VKLKGADLDYFVAKAVEHRFVLHMNTTAFFMTRKISDLLLQARLSMRFSIHSGKHVVETFRQRFPHYQTMAAQLGVSIKYGTMPSRVVAAYNLKRLANEATAFVTGKKLFPLWQSRGSCLAPWFGQLVIRQSGRVILCCSANYVLGDLNRQTLGEVWNAQPMRRIRQAFHQGYLPRLCGYCQGFSFGNYPRNAFVNQR
jgi:hypothetical protein